MQELGLRTVTLIWPDERLLRKYTTGTGSYHCHCGQVCEVQDAYLSIIESLNHAGFDTSTSVKIKWVESENVTEHNAGEILKEADGIIIPGGFSDRGIEAR